MNGKVNDFDDRHICPKDGIACRAPEPGTSVIRWTRYDGTPETLPDLGRMILVHWINEMQIRTVNYGIHKLFDVGDIWSYLPEPPEGMNG